MSRIIAGCLAVCFLIGSGAENQASAAIAAEMHEEPHAGPADPVDPDDKVLSLREVISFALTHSPALRGSSKEIDIRSAEMESARADRLPKIDLTTGAARYRYPAPIYPISGSPLQGVSFPPFDNNIYDAGLLFSMPLYRGGRLERAVGIAELRRTLAENSYRLTQQELVFNLTSVYFKILQLMEFLRSAEESVRLFESQKRDAELFIEAGTAARVELLKTEVELAHAREGVLVTRNEIEIARETLKALMGMEDQAVLISPVAARHPTDEPERAESLVTRALARRPDYRAALISIRISEEQVKVAAGRRLPDVVLAGDFLGRAGDDFSFKENWSVVLRARLPLVDGGAAGADIRKASAELERSKEHERAVRLAVQREVRDAWLSLRNAAERIKVSQKGLDPARENLRIERLKYETGVGTTTDVTNAQSALLRAERDYHTARYEREVARAHLRKATGEDYPFQEEDPE